MDRSPNQLSDLRLPASLSLALAALAAALTLTGCHSAYIQADLVNASGQPLSLLELDYPSASFGTESLPAGAEYRYRFKVLGSGPTKLLWTDAHHKDHTAAGPSLNEGQQGSLQVTITAATATTGSTAVWTTNLQP
jgi:hypothetical protein